MKNISFKYKNSDIEVFNNINFDLEKNDCIGIIGNQVPEKLHLLI